MVRFERSGRRTVGLLTALNANGAFVTTRHAIDAGERLELEFELPERAQPLKALGQVVSTNGAAHFDGRSPMGLGIRFVSMDRATRAIIDEFLARAVRA